MTSKSVLKRHAVQKGEPVAIHTDNKEDSKMLGNVSTDELVEMGKTHPRSALTIAYSEGVIVGINRAKAQQAQTIAELREQIQRLGEMANICTYSELGEICSYCNCKRKVKGNQ